MTAKRIAYTIAALLVALVLAVLVAFMVYGEKLPYMAHQQCGRITHDYTFCSELIHLPNID
jgi:hypothetical protein